MGRGTLGANERRFDGRAVGFEDGFTNGITDGYTVCVWGAEELLL